MTSPPQPQSRSVGIPTWLLVVWWLLCAVGALMAWYLVVMLAAFGCDSSWNGCENVGAGIMLGYPVLVGVGLIALLVWPLLRVTKTVRITAFLLMPVWVILSVVLTFLIYWAFANLATAS